MAFQALYSWQANPVPLEELIAFSWIEDKKIEKYRQDGTEAFAKLLLTGALENIDIIDKTINDHLEHWDIDRLNRVDLAILRISCYSILYQNDIHPSIIIDEAIEICREFGADGSYKFINGVLDSIRKTGNS